MKRLIIAAFAIGVLAGCEKESSEDVASDTAVTFASSQIGTRTSGDSWEEEDQVGVYMYKMGHTSTGDYALARENVLYESDGEGDFSTTSPIYYPQSDKVDFYAYYPYESDTDGNRSIDITKQNLADGGFDQGAVDFMTASLTGQQKSEGALSFNFNHKLALVTFVITKKVSITSLSGVKVSISGVNTTAEFGKIGGSMTSPGDSGAVEFKTVESEKDGDNVIELTATAILLPETISTNAVISFEISADPLDDLKASFPVAANLTAGCNHSYNISIGYEGASFGEATVTGWGSSTPLGTDPIDAEETL